MSIRTLLKEQNDWVLADHIERLKSAGFILFMGGTALLGVALLIVGLVR